MVPAVPASRRDRVAIVISIALHCCGLAIWAAMPRPTFPTADPDERTLLASIVRIERLQPTPRPREVPRHAERAPVAPPAPMPVIHAAVTREHAARKLVVADEQRAAPAPPATHVAPKTVAVAPRAEPTAEPVQAPGAAATAAPAASPAPSTVPATTGRTVADRDDEGVGNFGETYPASIDPAARGALVAGIAGAVVRVSVDENGHATAIQFVRDPADPALRDELRARLLAAHFIPAACNGLRCAGTLTLRT